MDKYNLVKFEQVDVEAINGGSVASGTAVLVSTVGTCAAILGGGSSLLLGVGVIAACAPAAIVVGVAGATIGGLMIGQGIANGDIA